MGIESEKGIERERHKKHLQILLELPKQNWKKLHTTIGKCGRENSGWAKRVSHNAFKKKHIIWLGPFSLSLPLLAGTLHIQAHRKNPIWKRQAKQKSIESRSGIAHTQRVREKRVESDNNNKKHSIKSLSRAFRSGIYRWKNSTTMAATEKKRCTIVKCWHKSPRRSGYSSVVHLKRTRPNKCESAQYTESLWSAIKIY